MKSANFSNKYKKYYEAINYLETLGNINGGYRKANIKTHPNPKMFLDRMNDLLNKIGNPEIGFKYIHITGTAGKGSVSSLVHEKLSKTQKSIGIFTSPFVVSTIEKIQVNSKYIDPIVFAELVGTIKPHVDQMILESKYGSPSYFEMIFAIALLYFKKEKCEYVILEVGLGGQYDATNIIKKPIITSITNISLDHTNILGNKLEDIAIDKAGIIKNGSIFFTSEENKKILKIFRDRCTLIGANYNKLNVDKLDYNLRNQLLADSICKSIGVDEVILNAKSILSLPARFEIIKKKPFIIIDGAHNPSKIGSTVFNLSKLKYKDLVLVIAISSDKDWKSMLKIIIPIAKKVYITRFSSAGRQAANPKLLFNYTKKYLRRGSSVYFYSDPIKAYECAIKELTTEDTLLVTGSFYLAGEIRSIYCPEEKILENRNSSIKN